MAFSSKSDLSDLFGSCDSFTVFSIFSMVWNCGRTWDNTDSISFISCISFRHSVPDTLKKAVDEIFGKKIKIIKIISYFLFTLVIIFDIL